MQSRPPVKRFISLYIRICQYVGVKADSSVAVGVGTEPGIGMEAKVSNLLQMGRNSTMLTGQLAVDGQITSSKNVLADLGCNQSPLDPPNFDEDRLNCRLKASRICRLNFRRGQDRF